MSYKTFHFHLRYTTTKYFFYAYFEDKGFVLIELSDIMEELLLLLVI